MKDNYPLVPPATYPKVARVRSGMKAVRLEDIRKNKQTFTEYFPFIIQ